MIRISHLLDRRSFHTLFVFNLLFILPACCNASEKTIFNLHLVVTSETVANRKFVEIVTTISFGRTIIYISAAIFRHLVNQNYY